MKPWGRIALSMSVASLPFVVVSCGGSNANPPPALNPQPAISSITPTSVPAGGSSFTLTVNGSGFVTASELRWNGASRTTTFVSSTQLMALILAGDTGASGTAQVNVFNPPPGGGTSSQVDFVIEPHNPVPALLAITPLSAMPGSSAFTLTVDGSGFVTGSVAQWNGADRATTFVSGKRMTAAIPASDVATTGTAQVTVVSPAPGGGTSLQVTFTIGAMTPATPQAYVTNSDGVLVIDTNNNTPISSIAADAAPRGVAFTPDGAYAYVTNFTSSTVSVIATSVNRVIDTISVGRGPYGVAITPDGTRAYVASSGLDKSAVSVIETGNNTVVATITVGSQATCVAITPDGSRAYVVNASLDFGSVSVVDTVSNTVVATLVTNAPSCVALSPDGARLYVANYNTNDVSVIDTGSNTVVARIAVGISPFGVAVTPDGTRVYVANRGALLNAGSISVIDTATNTVVATINVGGNPCCETGIAIQRSH